MRSEHTFRDLCQEQSSLLTGSTCNWGKAHKMPCISRCGWPIRCFRVAWKVIDLSNVEPVVHCASNFQPKWTEAPVYLLWMSEKAFGPRKSMKMGLKFELPILMIRNEMVGERGFEPPTPWSRTWVPGANFVATQSFEWCFNRLILAQSRQFWRNVNPPIATLARVSFHLGELI